MPLKDIKFSDLYLGQEHSWLSGVPNTNDPIPAPPDCNDELAALRKLCQETAKTTSRDEFSVSYNGTAYRSSLLKSIAEDVFVLRRFPDRVPSIEEIGLNSTHVSMLLQPKQTGLIVVAGAFGQGKTTTASALIAGRIAKFGGVAVCIEDPPEMPLQGKRGEGVIYQRWAEEGGFAHECRQAARWAPSIIFVGEVRDSETATEALKASINGRLVVCTIHSNSVTTAVERLYTLANGVAGSSDDVANLMSIGCRAIVHQRLEGEPRRPKIEFLYIDPKDANVQSLIKQRKFAQLPNEIILQQNRLLMNARRSD
ncbi:MAG: ATPase, T2SS/T4P/T4SS family [Propionivibrio sp.]